MWEKTTRSLPTVAVAAAVMAGCARPSAPVVEPAETGMRQVTFHVPEMGERLKLFWSDWPNRVKQALAGLEGVEVEDEWDRNPDLEDLENLLFIRYDATKVTQAQLLATIKKEQFDAEVKQDQ